MNDIAGLYRKYFIAMKDPPLISVVMPACNGESTIERAITSILTQTDPDIELIVVDDGSGDRTGPILAHHAVQDHRIRILTLSHGGIVQALNAGVEIARGRYIARMDSDDISLPGRLQRQCEHLDAHPTCGVVSCRVEIPPARQKRRWSIHEYVCVDDLCRVFKCNIDNFFCYSLLCPHTSHSFASLIEAATISCAASNEIRTSHYKPDDTLSGCERRPASAGAECSAYQWASPHSML
ncbi:MAG: glycosyltransferase [Chitinivibrionales bacterium]|nr:glycosyltransferase [Chitinivibrionales bacterium]